MRTHESRPSPQIVVAAGTLAVAVPVLVLGWLVLVLQKAQLQDPLTLLLAVSLMAALILSYRFPIHIRLSSKIYMGSAALYLMAVLLPPVLAATIAALGTAVGEAAVQSRTGNPVS